MKKVTALVLRSPRRDDFVGSERLLPDGAGPRIASGLKKSQHFDRTDRKSVV